MTPKLRVEFVSFSDAELQAWKAGRYSLVGQCARPLKRILRKKACARRLRLCTARLSSDAPRSAPAAALLARAHRANGNRIEAAQNYSRAIELSDTPRAFPSYTHAIRELSALEGETEVAAAVYRSGREHGPRLRRRDVSVTPGDPRS